MQKILICNSNSQEIEELHATLGSGFAVTSLQSWSGQTVSLDAIDAVVLDSNFTEAQGFDFLMAVASAAHVPILLIAPPDDPQCAIEARRLGAFNYLVKTPKLHSVLQLALHEMFTSFNDLQQLKQTILALRRRVAELEAQLNAYIPQADVAATTGAAADSQRKAAFQEIARRLQSGEINLPAYPSISLELSALIEANAELKQVARLLAKDMAVAARLISVANSAAYYSVHRSTNVEQAVSALGLRLTKEYVDIIANRALYVVRNRKYQPYLVQLWKHGVACAHACQLLAEQLHPRPAVAVFEMGLLHDIGKLLLMQIVSEMDMAGGLGEGVSQEDLDAFLHAHHGAAGLRLVTLWKLPDSYAEIVQYHEAPDEAPAPSRELLLVHLANLLAHQAGYGRYTPETDDAALSTAAAALSFSPDRLQEIQDRVRLLVEQSGLDLD